MHMITREVGELGCGGREMEENGHDNNRKRKGVVFI